MTPQRNQDFNGENVDVVFVVEDTSNLYLHFNVFKHSYLENLLKQFCPPLGAVNGGMFGEYPVQQFGLVLYSTNAPGTNEVISCFPPTHDITVFQSQIKDIRFEGGGAESHAFVVEGMGVALEIFDDMDQTRIHKKTKVAKICVIIGQGSPYLMPCQFSQKYTGYTCEALAKCMNERDIKLSVLSPRRNLQLKKIFDAGFPEDSSIKDYGVDPNHMILVSGWALPVLEQPDVAKATNSPHSPAKKPAPRKAKSDAGPANWSGSPHPMQGFTDSPLSSHQVSNANLNTPSPRGMITDHSQLHAPDVPAHQFPDPGQRMPGMQPAMQPGMQPGMQQPGMQPGMQPMRGTQQAQQRMQGPVVMMQPNQMLPGMLQPGHMMPGHPGMRPGIMQHPGQQMIPPQTTHDNFQQVQMQHQRQQQLQQMQQQQMQQQQAQQQRQQSQVQQQQQQSAAPQQSQQQQKRTAVWKGQLECWEGRPTPLVLMCNIGIDENNMNTGCINISMWPERVQFSVIPGDIPSTMVATKKACKLYVNLNPNNDKAQEAAKAQLENMLTSELGTCGLVTATLHNMVKEQAFVFISKKMKTFMGIYPVNQQKFQEELQAKLQANLQAKLQQSEVPGQDKVPQQQQVQQPNQARQQQQQQMATRLEQPGPQGIPGTMASQPGAMQGQAGMAGGMPGQAGQMAGGIPMTSNNNNNMLQHIIAQQQMQQNPRLIRAQGNTVQMMQSGQPSNPRMSQMQNQQQISLQQMHQFHNQMRMPRMAGQMAPGQLQQMQGGPMPGQMQPGQMQPGQMQPGQMQPGQMQPGQMQPGQMQPGQMQHAQMQPGQMQPGQMQPGQMQPGQMQPGHMPQSQMVQQGTGQPMQLRIGQGMPPMDRNEEMMMRQQQQQMQMMMQQQNRGGMTLQQQQQLQQQNLQQQQRNQMLRQQQQQQQQWARQQK